VVDTSQPGRCCVGVFRGLLAITPLGRGLTDGAVERVSSALAETAAWNGDTSGASTAALHVAHCSRRVLPISGRSTLLSSVPLRHAMFPYDVAIFPAAMVASCAIPAALVWVFCTSATLLSVSLSTAAMQSALSGCLCSLSAATTLPSRSAHQGRRRFVGTPTCGSASVVLPVTEPASEASILSGQELVALPSIRGDDDITSLSRRSTSADRCSAAHSSSSTAPLHDSRGLSTSCTGHVTVSDVPPTTASVSSAAESPTS